MLTSRLGAYISRYGDFCANDNNNDDDDNDDTTDYFTPCACARGNDNRSFARLAAQQREGRSGRCQWPVWYLILNSDIQKYSGTPLKRTPLGPKILSVVARCPLLRGSWLTTPLLQLRPAMIKHYCGRR